MIRSGVVALAAAVVLTACVGGSDPKPSPTKTAASKLVTPKAGDCFADADSKLADADPDFTSKVKCTKPHLYEVTGTSHIPDRYLEAPGGPTSKVKEDYGDEQVADDLSFALFARTTCSAHLWQSLGVDAAGVSVSGVYLSEIDAVPGMAGIVYQHTVTPEPRWSKDEHDLICFAEFEELSGGKGSKSPGAVSSYNLEPVAAKFLGSHFPDERRLCLVSSAEDEPEPEPCTRAHDAEIVFTYDARHAFGLSFVNKVVKAEGRDDKISDRIINVCRDFLPKVLKSPVAPDLFVWGSIDFDGYSGWTLPPDHASESYPYPVQCQVWPSDDELVLAPGTVVHRPDYPDLEDRSYRSDA